jgi:hypothetical protein
MHLGQFVVRRRQRTTRSGESVGPPQVAGVHRPRGRRPYGVDAELGSAGVLCMPHDVEWVGVGWEHLQGASVQPAALTRDDRLGDRLLRQHVGERELVTVGLGQQSLVAQLLERGQQPCFLERREPGELREGRCAAEDGGGVDDGPPVVGEAEQGASGRLRHRARQIERVGGRAQLSGVEQLADQERVPARALVDVDGEARCSQADGAPQQIADLVDAEGRQLEVLGVDAASNLVDEVEQVVALPVESACGDKRRTGQRTTHDASEHREHVRVSPLQIVHHEQRPTPAERMLENCHDRIGENRCGRNLGRDAGRGEVVAEQRIDRGPVPAERVGNPLPSSDVSSERVVDGTEQPGVVRFRRALEAHDVDRKDRHRFPQQACLAHARFALEHHEARVGVDRPSNAIQLVPAADERPRPPVHARDRRSRLQTGGAVPAVQGFRSGHRSTRWPVISTSLTPDEGIAARPLT